MEKTHISIVGHYLLSSITFTCNFDLALISYGPTLLSAWTVSRIHSEQCQLRGAPLAARVFWALHNSSILSQLFVCAESYQITLEGTTPSRCPHLPYQ